jgi:hypothetical protein
LKSSRGFTNKRESARKQNAEGIAAGFQDCAEAQAFDPSSWISDSRTSAAGFFQTARYPQFQAVS